MNISLGNTLVWDTLVGAASYTIELLNQGGEVVATYTRDDPSITALALLAGQPQGNYRVRVRGDVAGFSGPFTDLLPLEFALFGAPTGLRVE